MMRNNSESESRRHIGSIKRPPSKLPKCILLNAMFSGSYLKNHLGHEVINLFAADNGEHYIYINPVGKIARYKEYNINCVLLGQLVKDGVFKVIAKATGLTMLPSTQRIIQQINATSQLPLSPALEKEHLEELKDVTYSGVAIDKLFNEPTQVLATFKADSVVYVKGDMLLSASNMTEVEAGTSVYMLPEAKHDGAKAYHFAKTNPYMYFPEKNIKGNPMKDYEVLDKLIKDKDLWEDHAAKPFDPNIVTNCPPITMVEQMGKEDDELAYSNLIFYWLNKEQAVLRKFVTDFLMKKDNSIAKPKPSDFIRIDRECNHTDLLIRCGDTCIIIENKIKAGISVYANGTYSNQLVKYKEELKQKGVIHIHGFVLSPDYRKMNIAQYDKDYKELKYSELLDYFKKNQDNVFPYYISYVEVPEIVKNQFEEFLRDLKLHAETIDSLNYINMIRRFEEAVRRAKTVVPVCL